MYIRAITVKGICNTLRVQLTALTPLLFALTLFGTSMNVSGDERQNAILESTSSVSTKTTDKPRNWYSRFTFEGHERPGLYTVDPHVWIYTKEFAERFGMPKEWISDELMGVEAAAWHVMKTGHVTCGWGRKKDACKEDDMRMLELYIDTKNIRLPWAPWSRKSDMLVANHWGNSQRFLVPQECEMRRENSISPVGDMGTRCEARITKQPLASPHTGEEIFFFKKAEAYKGQGNIAPIYAYDKQVYSDIAWFQIPYTRPVGLSYNEPGAVILTLETRTSTLGKTLRQFHKVFLPTDFDRRVKLILDAKRDMQRKFYKDILNIR